MGRQSCSAACDDNCRLSMADLDDELEAMEDDQVKDIQQAANVGNRIKFWSFIGLECTVPSSMLLQHAAGSRHLPSCNRAHIACTWRSKVGVGSLASSFPPLEPGVLKGGKILTKI